MRSAEEKMTRAYLRRRREERRVWRRKQMLINIGCAIGAAVSLAYLVYLDWGALVTVLSH